MGPRTAKRGDRNLTFLIMRKYYRLALLLIAITSCSLMLVYQHKYSKLNLLFNLMNAFSNSDTGCNRKFQDLSRSLKSDFPVLESISGGSAWTEVFPHIHMYSTFWLNNSTHTIAFIDDATVAGLEKLTCVLLYDKHRESLPDAVTIQLFQKHKNSLFVIMKCQQPSQNIGYPYGIVFKHSNATSVISLPVIVEESYVGKFSMCVEPLPSGFSDVQRTIEYLVYHHHVGVNHFVFYDRGISASVKKLLLELAPKCNIFVTLLPWNVPFAFEKPSKSHKEYFVDCIHRVLSRNYSSFLLKSDLNQFVVLKEKRNLTTLMSDAVVVSNPPRFSEEKFCSEYSDDLFASQLSINFITLLKNKVYQGSTGVLSLIYNVQHLHDVMNSTDFKVWLYKGFPQKSQVLPKHIGAVYSYKSCDETMETLDKNFMTDKYMWRFKNLFFKSRLYNLAKESKLISDA